MAEIQELRFFVPGTPAPGGSKRAFVNRKTGRAQIVEDCKRNAPWRASVAAEAIGEMEHLELLTGPISVLVLFFMPRPKGHYGTGKNAKKLKPSAPPFPITKPDATKLWRAAEDALTGIIWRDDAQVVDQRVLKLYAEGSQRKGMLITITTKGSL